MKKRTAIFFTLFATLIILVHAVVPHHHHESSVCIEKILCPDCNTHKHSLSQSECNHHNENGSQNCALKLVVFLPANQEKQDFKGVTSSNKNYQSNVYHAILFTCKFIAFVPGIISDAQIPLILYTYFRFVSASKGLRAPPIA